MRFSFGLALACLSFSLLGACKSPPESPPRQVTLNAQDSTIRDLRDRNAELRQTFGDLEAENERLQIRIASLEEQARVGESVAIVQDNLSELEERARRDRARMLEVMAKPVPNGGSALAPGVTERAHPEGRAFEMAEVLLFEPGQAVLKSSGKTALRELSAQRLANSSFRLRVEGHTDDQPVVKTRSQWPRGNLELSLERALVVADFLRKDAGVSGERVSVVGHGSAQPRVENRDDASRARNRRVEVILLSKPTQPR